VAVGLSGGVDSAVTALLLLERGCSVIGVTMSHWKGGYEAATSALKGAPRHSCFGPGEADDIEECRAFCQEQGMAYHVVDVAAEYEQKVLCYFRREYRAGRTPNPCVRCNGEIKFGALLEGIKGLGVGYDYFCTGHYASLVRPDTALVNGKRPACIRAARDTAKDQSYFLYRVPSAVLEQVRFPLSGLTKAEVRQIARERGLVAANRRESQDFVPLEYRDALFAGKEPEPGDFVDLEGRVIGRHRGIERYTVGQRKGLGIGGAADPLYVRSIDAEANRIVLGTDETLLCRALLADDWVWPGDAAPAGSFRGDVKIRLGSRAIPALIGGTEEEGVRRIDFDEAVRAAAPGQSAVAYIDGVIAGGGTILRSD
jgi:tRNA-specific 2-thiouridylase